MALLKDFKRGDNNILTFAVFEFAAGEDDKAVLKDARFRGWMKNRWVNTLNYGLYLPRKIVFFENLFIPV